MKETDENHLHIFVMLGNSNKLSKWCKAYKQDRCTASTKMWTSSMPLVLVGPMFHNDCVADAVKRRGLTGWEGTMWGITTFRRLWRVDWYLCRGGGGCCLTSSNFSVGNVDLRKMSPCPKALRATRGGLWTQRLTSEAVSPRPRNIWPSLNLQIDRQKRYIFWTGYTIHCCEHQRYC